jgi:hypothetical protein
VLLEHLIERSRSFIALSLTQAVALYEFCPFSKNLRPIGSCDPTCQMFRRMVFQVVNETPFKRQLADAHFYWDELSP